MQEENKKKSIPVVDFGSLNSPASNSVLKSARDSFLESGCLLVKNLFDGEYIASLHDFYCQEYSRYFEDREYIDALTVGDRRRQIALVMDGPFNDPHFYANQKLMPLLMSLLGDDMILGSMGSVVSSPGAADQHIHLDHANIYEIDDQYLGSGRRTPMLPPYAITVVIPLVRIDEVSGCTRSWPGTHLIKLDDSFNHHNSWADFTAELGDCYLMDYRLLHGGMPNRSDKHRPVIYNVYYRPWFRDVVNYSKNLPIVVSDENYAKVPANFRHLFSWLKIEMRDAGAAVQCTNQQ